MKRNIMISGVVLFLILAWFYIYNISKQERINKLEKIDKYAEVSR